MKIAPFQNISSFLLSEEDKVTEGQLKWFLANLYQVILSRWIRNILHIWTRAQKIVNRFEDNKEKLRKHRSWEELLLGCHAGVRRNAMQNNLPVPGSEGLENALSVHYNKLTSEDISGRPESTISLYFTFIAFKIHSSSDHHVYIVD